MRAWVIAVCLLVGCGDAPTTTALFTLPELAPDSEFYELPFPNDVHRRSGGGLDLARLPSSSLIVRAIRDAAADPQNLDGFGLNQSTYFRFDGALDPTSLPDPLGSVADQASVNYDVLVIAALERPAGTAKLLRQVGVPDSKIVTLRPGAPSTVGGTEVGAA